MCVCVCMILQTGLSYPCSSHNFWLSILISTCIRQKCQKAVEKEYYFKSPFFVEGIEREEKNIESFDCHIFHLIRNCGQIVGQRLALLVHFTRRKIIILMSIRSQLTSHRYLAPKEIKKQEDWAARWLSLEQLQKLTS